MTRLLLALPFAFVALLIACDNGDGGEVQPTGDVTPAVTVSPQPDGETPTGEPEVCQPNPDPATPEFQVIDQPSAGDAVTSPVTISGQVLAFEATYQIGVFDADGNTIDVDPSFGTAGGAEIGELAPFSIDVSFDVDKVQDIDKYQIHLGAEFGMEVHPEYFTYFRAGLNSVEDQAFTTGLGIAVPYVQFDYAYITERESEVLGSNHRVSLTARF